MNLFENLRFAIRALAGNKLRSMLTMLGIIIGVAAVITLISVGEGVESFVTGEFEGLGNNLLFVLPGQGGPDNPGPRRSGGAGLTDRDAILLADPLSVPDIVQVVPAYDRPALVVYRENETTTSISGTTPTFTVIRNFYPAAGRFFDERDVAAASRVAVLGQTAYEELFPDGGDPIGSDIKINNVAFKVIGLMEKKGGSGFNDQDDLVLIPITTAQRRLFPARRADGQLRIDYVMVEVIDEARTDAAITQIELVLRESHRIGFDEEDDFSVLSQSDLVGAFSQVTGVLTVFLGIVAGISLIVGGIGIMNIMLVSVTERTREIGLRKAVGARPSDILGQFLVEAILLAVIGGLIGLIIGASGAMLISRLMEQLQATVSLRSVALAIGFSAAVGLIFGVYPAWRASKLSPIEALRYE